MTFRAAQGNARARFSIGRALERGATALTID
jgi:hypothetical protein